MSLEFYTWGHFMLWSYSASNHSNNCVRFVVQNKTSFMYVLLSQNQIHCLKWLLKIKTISVRVALFIYLIFFGESLLVKKSGAFFFSLHNGWLGGAWLFGDFFKRKLSFTMPLKNVHLLCTMFEARFLSFFYYEDLWILSVHISYLNFISGQVLYTVGRTKLRSRNAVKKKWNKKQQKHHFWRNFSSFLFFVFLFSLDVRNCCTSVLVMSPALDSWFFCLSVM